MKVFGGCYDGTNRVIVAAKTKKAAHAAVSAALGGISYSSWDMFTDETGNDREVEVATSSPGIVFSAKNDYRSEFRPVSKAQGYSS